VLLLSALAPSNPAANATGAADAKIKARRRLTFNADTPMGTPSGKFVNYPGDCNMRSRLPFRIAE
jgi:hypothetical protein